MEIPGTHFVVHNINGRFEQNEEIQNYFHLEAPPDTLIWRKSISQDQASAPMLTTARQSFLVAEVTVSVDLEMEWDQAGLVIFTDFNALMARSTTSTTSTTARRGTQADNNGKWLKLGLGMSRREPGVCTVLANANCGPDSSFTPINTSSCHGPLPSLRVKLERVKDDLAAWYKIPDSPEIAASQHYRSPAEVSRDWKKIRQVAGFFSSLDKDAAVTVGCYVSRPITLDEDDKSVLFAKFEELELL